MRIDVDVFDDRRHRLGGCSKEKQRTEDGSMQREGECLRIAGACREVDDVEMKRKALSGTGAKIHMNLQNGLDLKNENRAAEQGLPGMAVPQKETHRFGGALVNPRCRAKAAALH